MPSGGLQHKLRRILVSLRGPPSPLALASAKSSLALTLSVVLPFLRPFNKLSAKPVALPWIVLVSIICQPGASVGRCIECCSLGLLGLGGGSLVFFVLAKLGQYGQPIGQGFVFAAWVYLSALVRYKGARYISIYLIGVLFAFQGIYTTVVEDPRDRNSWLLAYFQAYGWGFAISLAVNILVWPVTSESELKDLIISSLQHVSTLSHLTCKTFSKEIQADEIDVRDLLISTIRGDFAALSAHMNEASYEIVYSRFTMTDYRAITTKVRGLQQALITSSSALELIDKLDPSGVNVKRHLLKKKETTATFDDFRHSIDLCIAAILDQVSGLTLSELETRAMGKDLEMQPVAPQLSRQPSVITSRTSRNLPSISARLRREVGKTQLRQQRLRDYTLQGQGSFSRTTSRSDVPLEPVEFCRASWAIFAETQTEAIIRLIKDGGLQVEDSLRISEGMPSLQVVYSDRLPKAWTSSLVSSTPLRQVRPLLARDNTFHHQPGSAETIIVDEAPCSEALTKHYSLLFGLGQFTDELCELHGIVSAPRRKRIQFHILDRRNFRARWKRDPDSMTLHEALAALSGTPFVARPVGFFQRLMNIEAWFRSNRSLYALKVAIGASIYALLVLIQNPRSFFEKYGMTSSLITVIVAISPSMGQTLATFLLQLLGTGIGTLYGMVILLIFQHIGYSYSPYGLGVAMAIWAFGISWPFYKYPKYYTAALLALNGAGNIFVNEWIYNEVLHAQYPTPALRTGYAITSMLVSISIAAVFQILIFRDSARRQLRLRIAAITFALSSYNVILQSNINAVAPADEAPAPPQEALEKIQKELIKRETRIQGDIIALRGLYDFAAVEPQFVSPFPAEVLLKIIQSHQLILDRLREGRTAVGLAGFGTLIHKDFASQLYPYRLHSQRLARTLFYLSATSLVSKTPLPRDVPSSKSTWASFENDALVLSRRLSKQPDGEKELRQDGFLRYWFYLVALGAVSSELEQLETYLLEYFGDPEVTNQHLT